VALMVEAAEGMLSVSNNALFRVSWNRPVVSINVATMPMYLFAKIVGLTGFLVTFGSTPRSRHHQNGVGDDNLPRSLWRLAPQLIAQYFKM
jgi:hypothetical protein